MTFDTLASYDHFSQQQNFPGVRLQNSNSQARGCWDEEEGGKAGKGLERALMKRPVVFVAFCLFGSSFPNSLCFALRSMRRREFKI